MKELVVETFMSWENESSVWNKETNKYESETVRAIALCDPTGYFMQAINCMRDGDMGEKDENGVYGRIWYGDYIDCYGNEHETLRPATPAEVELYKQYCPIVDDYFWPYEKAVAEVRTADATYIIKQRRGWMMRHLLKVAEWFRSIPRNIHIKVLVMKYRWQHRNDKPNTEGMAEGKRILDKIFNGTTDQREIEMNSKYGNKKQEKA